MTGKHIFDESLHADVLCSLGKDNNMFYLKKRNFTTDRNLLGWYSPPMKSNEYILFFH